MTRAWRAAVIVVLLGSASVLAVSNAGGERQAVSPAQTVKSSDGGLLVSVPRGALPKATRIRVRTLSRGQFPPELRKVTFKPGSKLYALEPAGLRFLKPVTITRRINAKLQGFDLKKAVPGIVLTTRSAGGKWEILRKHTVRADGATLVVTATTRHFSTIVAFDGGARLSLVPPTTRAVVGARFSVKLKAEIDSKLRRSSVHIDRASWRAQPVVTKVEDAGTRGATFSCAKTGSGAYFVNVTLEEDDLARLIFTLGLRSHQQEFILEGRATCTPAPGPELALACVLVAHSPFGNFPSFMRWLLAFAPASLPANARAELTVTGVNGGQPVSGAIDSATGKVELQGGISSFGPKQVQRLAVAGQDVTQQLVAKVGSAPTVTSSQGLIAGTCP